MSSSSCKYANVWRLLHEYNFQIDMNEHGLLICCICHNLAKNAQRNSDCGCLYCIECVTSYVATDEKHCPGRSGQCKALVINLVSALRPDDAANDRISDVSVPCPIDYCSFRDKLKRIGAHIESQHTSACRDPIIITSTGVTVESAQSAPKIATGTVPTCGATGQNKGPATEPAETPHQSSSATLAAANHESREHELRKEIDAIREQLAQTQRESGATEAVLTEVRDELAALKRTVEQYRGKMDAIGQRTRQLEQDAAEPAALGGLLHQTAAGGGGGDGEAVIALGAASSATNGMVVVTAGTTTGVRDAREASEDWELDLFSGDMDSECLDISAGPPKRRRTEMEPDEDQEPGTSLPFPDIRALIAAEVARQTAQLLGERHILASITSLTTADSGARACHTSSGPLSAAPAPLAAVATETSNRGQTEKQPSPQTAAAGTACPDAAIDVDLTSDTQPDGRTPTNRRRLKRDLPRAIPVEAPKSTEPAETPVATMVTPQGKVVPVAKSWPSSKDPVVAVQSAQVTRKAETPVRVHINTKPKQTALASARMLAQSSTAANSATDKGAVGSTVASKAVIHPVLLQRKQETAEVVTPGDKSVSSRRLSKARQQLQTGADSTVATISSGATARRGGRGGGHLGNSASKMSMMAMIHQEQQLQLARTQLNRHGNTMVHDTSMGTPWQLQMLNPGSRAGLGATSGVPFELRIDRLADKLMQARSGMGNTSVFSVPFYTSGPGAHDKPGSASRRGGPAASPPGYRLCLRVDPVSSSTGTLSSASGVGGGYMGLFFRLVRGEHDDRLSWPMPLAITVSLIDQVTLLPYTSRTFDHASAPDSWKYVFHRPKAEQQQHHGNTGGNNFWFGTSQFIHYDFLYNNPSLVKNDSIVIRCSTGL